MFKRFKVMPQGYWLQRNGFGRWRWMRQETCALHAECSRTFRYRWTAVRDANRDSNLQYRFQLGWRNV